MKNRILTIFVCMALLSCVFHSSKEKYYTYSINLWRGTPVWEFAKAVNECDTIGANSIFERRIINVDYREPRYGASLLFWAIEDKNVEMVEYLLKKRANPNLHNTWTGLSPIMWATINTVDNKDIIKLMLAYGGNPNEYVKEDEPIKYEARELFTPLTFAASFDLETVKLLVDAGGDVNFFPESEPGNTALFGSINRSKADILKYLLIDCHADYSKCYVKTFQGDSIGFFELVDKQINQYPPEDNDTKIVKEYIEREKKEWRNRKHGSAGLR